MIVWRWVADISNHVEIKCSEIFKKCAYSSLATDEAMDTTSTVQICIFAHGITTWWSVWRTCRSPFNAKPDKGIQFHSGSTM